MDAMWKNPIPALPPRSEVQLYGVPPWAQKLHERIKEGKHPGFMTDSCSFIKIKVTPEMELEYPFLMAYEEVDFHYNKKKEEKGETQ